MGARRKLSTGLNLRKSRPLIAGGRSATFSSMSERSNSPAMAYDPFGEPVEIGCQSASQAGDRRARSVAVTGFWLVAATLTASRIYFADEPVAQMVANAHAQVAAFITAIL
jgi:hypothetical protein